MHASRPALSFPLGLAAAAALAAALTPVAAAEPPTNLAELRARGQAGLDDLLARYRAAEDADPAAWETAIDRVAAQRYAAHAGLYWYTDLALAEQEAQRVHRPILALRLLGDLREDLSCANSRLFRTLLYADPEVAAFLRSHFVLYWSSERPVPKVTIDFGDGRKIVRTTTGNSAHYVLDDHGHVLDVLPGLYAPRIWIAELAQSAELADRVRGASDADRMRAVAAYHAAVLDQRDRVWDAFHTEGQHGSVYVPPNGPAYVVDHDRPRSDVARAQRASISKLAMEMPDLRTFGFVDAAEVPADDTDTWATIGSAVWNLRIIPFGRVMNDPAASTVIDPVSRAFVLQLAAAGPVPVRDPDHMIAQLQRHVLADTALNDLRLRPQIRRQLIAHPEGDLAALNGWIYDTVFATPRSDAWLGLLPRTQFTGLPGDGAMMP